MKINLYNKDKNYDIYAENLIKLAGVGTPVVESFDELAESMSSGIKAIKQQVDDLLRGVVKVSPEAARTVKELSNSIEAAYFMFDEVVISAKNIAGELKELDVAVKAAKTPEEIAELEQKIASNKQLYTNLIAGLEKEKIDLTQKVGKLSDYKELDAAKISELEEGLEAYSKESLELEQAMKVLENKNLEIKTALELATKNLASVQTELLETNRLLNILGPENKDLSEKLAKAYTEIGSLEAKLKSLTDAGKNNEASVIRLTIDQKKQTAAQLSSAAIKNDAVKKQALETEVAAIVSASKAKSAAIETAKATDEAAKVTSQKAPGLWEKTKKSFDDWIAMKAAGKTGTTTTAIKLGLVKSAIFYGLIGTGLIYLAYRTYNWWNDTGKIGAIKKQAATLDSAIKNAYDKLSKVDFRESQAKAVTNTYLKILSNSFNLGTQLINSIEDQTQFAENARKLQILTLLTDNYLETKELLIPELLSSENWSEAIAAVEQLGDQLDSLAVMISEDFKKISQRPTQVPSVRPDQTLSPEPKLERRPPPDPNDKGIDVLNQKIYLSQYPNLDYATRSAAPFLVQKVLLSPTGLAFWDPENRTGGGYLPNTGPVSDQVVRYVKFFMNPQVRDRDWAHGPISNEHQLRRFMRKNLPAAARKHDSGYKTLRRKYRDNKPKLSEATNNSQENMKNIQKRTQFLDKLLFSINNFNNAVKNIEKYSDIHSKEFYQGALKDLDDQYAKSYYTGLKRMYDEKLGERTADYKMLYEPHGTTGVEILEQSHPQSVTIAPSMGRGGLIENVLEQQRHNIGVAKSIPTGNYRGKYASLNESLKSIAKKSSDSNEPEINSEINKVISDIDCILNGLQIRK